MYNIESLVTSTFLFHPQRKLLIATSLIVAVSLFVVVANYSEKPYFRLQPMFRQGFSSHWMFSKQPYKGFKPHLGYVSIPKQEPLKLHCELCSIVSSSGQMLGQAAGVQIDRSPCIWRMNNAPTSGFEHDVGHRTTLRVVSHTSVPLLLQKPHYFFGQGNNTVYVVWGPLRNMRKDGKGIVYNMLRQAAVNYPQARIYVTTEDRMNYCDMIFKKETGKDRIQSGSYLSTGWFTLILAMDMCKEIHIYGMINDTYCKTEGIRKVPYHYYEPGSRDECSEYMLHESAPYGGHRFITEKAVFAKWAKTHEIKFFNPSWQFS
ncbi:Alpha-N-acetylgalactosaminide alpha-2,6-sialyltransferase 3 [Takifugu flavidus]|uniref:alpha-N-acetylneuraminyl-2,3-beta-galactosyl-1,3-N-acetylgalactosaminide6-alpha-sialyltransferase n=1 Tax=Takifugu flavidus TaxID=433684 RepID=A0A5C6P3D5_9TELE|nr:Alpha-N-acetylgalactosaminide alpha-2,6-sialyltransferase 3 [Takifugu flavidus]|eukprot:XP_011614556.1 PREDICTED: alpha-N-acetylgalactosaminide alpha-2,6-sialyltransferase 3 isoform X1 [Takifugu rubripes]